MDVPVPWIIHAASQQLRASGESEPADTLAKIALLVELGVSTELAARIFLSGIRSRAAATELARLDATFGSSVSEISRTLRIAAFADQLRPLASSSTVAWLDLMVEDAAQRQTNPPPVFRRFTLLDVRDVDVLHARRLGEDVFLCTADGQTRVAVASTADLPFVQVANDPRFVFRSSNAVWKLEVRDPRLEESAE